MKRSKIIAIGLACLLFGSILSAIATRTITDSSDIWTGTIVWQGNIDFESGSYFNLSKKIYTSTGRVYNATAANIQTAIYSLSNSSGWVQLPKCDITITTPLKLGTNCWLRGQGNATVLRLANAANCSMIINHDTTNGNDNIRISDMRLEGNSLGQDEWVTAGYWYNCNHGIHFIKCDYAEIYNLFINNTHSLGILVTQGRYINVHDCIIEKAGWLYEQSGSSLEHYPGSGVWYWNTSNSLINNVQVINPYACGIVIEGMDATEKYWSFNVTIGNCYVSDCAVGYYFEKSGYHTITNCVADGCNDINCYGTAYGAIRTASATRNIKFNNIISTRGHNGIFIVGKNHTFTAVDIEYPANYGIYEGATNNNSYIGCTVTRNGAGYGIYSEGKNLSISNCRFIDTFSSSIYTTATADNCIITGNYVLEAGSNAIHTYGDYNIITNNIIQASADHGIRVEGDDGLIVGNILKKPAAGFKRGIYLSTANNWTVALNHIDGFAFGIQESSSDYNDIILNYLQNIDDTEISISGAHSRVNCTGYNDWNFYAGVS